MADRRKRSSRIQRDARLCARVTDLPQHPLKVRARFDLNGYDVGACGRNRAHKLFRMHDHEMRIEHRARVCSQSGYNRCAERKVRHEAIVH